MLSKTTMIIELAERSGESKSSCERMLEALSAVMTEELKGTGEVSLYGIGRFQAVERAARTGRDPRTCSPLQIPAKTGVKFKAAKALADKLNSK